jgi:hypothetical protein
MTKQQEIERLREENASLLKALDLLHRDLRAIKNFNRALVGEFVKKEVRESATQNQGGLFGR